MEQQKREEQSINPFSVASYPGSEQDTATKRIVGQPATKRSENEAL